jgi:hypothetical protein
LQIKASKEDEAGVKITLVLLSGSVVYNQAASKMILWRDLELLKNTVEEFRVRCTL